MIHQKMECEVAPKWFWWAETHNGLKIGFRWYGKLQSLREFDRAMVPVRSFIVWVRFRKQPYRAIFVGGSCRGNKFDDKSFSWKCNLFPLEVVK